MISVCTFSGYKVRMGKMCHIHSTQMSLHVNHYPKSARHPRDCFKANWHAVTVSCSYMTKLLVVHGRFFLYLIANSFLHIKTVLSESCSQMMKLCNKISPVLPCIAYGGHCEDRKGAFLYKAEHWRYMPDKTTCAHVGVGSLPSVVSQLFLFLW